MEEAHLHHHPHCRRLPATVMILLHPLLLPGETRVSRVSRVSREKPVQQEMQALSGMLEERPLRVGLELPPEMAVPKQPAVIHSTAQH